MDMKKNSSTMIIVGLAVLALIGGVFFMNANKKGTETPVNDAIIMEEEEIVAEETNTIVDVAVKAGNFTILAKALTEAGLIETLSSEGPFTVFAPTDEAFAMLPEETLTALLADKEALTKVLTYHVVSGKVMAEDVVKMTSAPTVQGQEVKIVVGEDGSVMINDAKVTSTDIEASNGVIHVIDKVLMPM